MEAQQETQQPPRVKLLIPSITVVCFGCQAAYTVFKKDYTPFTSEDEAIQLINATIGHYSPLIGFRCQACYERDGEEIAQAVSDLFPRPAIESERK